MTTNTFSILGDSPVGVDRDRLNFTTFIEPFAERLIGSIANSPFTVGIFADWGQGKSTVMKMLRAEVSKRGCPTIWFEPWKHNMREAVWKGLALTLVMEIRREARKNPSLMREVARKKEGLKEFIAKALWGTVVGREWAQDLVDAVQKEPWSPSLLHEFEENLNNLFELMRRDDDSLPPKPLVLFVDDLDRCLPDAALAVLEALKLIFNRPGLITIMGIAEAELSRSVLAAYGKEMREAQLDLDPAWGQKYIRKIIQMPFPLPTISEKSFDSYIGSCLSDSNVGPVLAKDPSRWLEVIREACESNLREVKRFINHFISEFDKAAANSPATQLTLEPPRVAFLLLLAWRFGDFLMYIRKQAGERDLLVRYQIFFAQHLPGGTVDPSVLTDKDEQFRQNTLLQAFFNRCFTGDTPLVLPFTDWNDIEPYLQFGLRSPKVTASGGSSAGAAIPNDPITAPPKPEAKPDVPSAVSTAATSPSTVVSPPPLPLVATETAKEFAARVQSLLSSGRLEEAESSAMAGIDLMVKMRDRSGEATLQDLLGSIYEALKRFDNAEEAYEKALSIANESGLKRESIGVLLNLARLNLSKNPTRARGFAEQGLKAAQEIGDPLSEANALVDLADACREVGQKLEASNFYNLSRSIYIRLHFVQGELNVLGRLSLLFSEDDPNEARLFNSLAMDLAVRLGDKRAQLRLLSNRAHIEQKFGGSPDGINEYYDKATRLAEELGEKDEFQDLNEEWTQFQAENFSAATGRDIIAPPRTSFKPRPRSKPSGRRLK